MEHLKAIVNNMRDEDELKVNYERSYDSVRHWLIRPVDKKGCGFDATFVDRIMPAVLQNIKDGKITFKSGKAFDLYLRDRCLEYERNVIKESAKIREEFFWNEFNYQQREGIRILSEIMDQNKSLKGWMTWLLISTGLLAAALLLALALVVRF